MAERASGPVFPQPPSASLSLPQSFSPRATPRHHVRHLSASLPASFLPVLRPLPSVYLLLLSNTLSASSRRPFLSLSFSTSVSLSLVSLLYLFLYLTLHGATTFNPRLRRRCASSSRRSSFTLTKPPRTCTNTYTPRTHSRIRAYARILSSFLPSLHQRGKIFMPMYRFAVLSARNPRA